MHRPSAGSALRRAGHEFPVRGQPIRGCVPGQFEVDWKSGHERRFDERRSEHCGSEHCGSEPRFSGLPRAA
jgi:hypothetical protein